MTDPTPQPDRIVPSACRIDHYSSRSCSHGTRSCYVDHRGDGGSYLPSPNGPAWFPEPKGVSQDARNINRLNHAVDQLAEALAAAGGDLLPYEGKRQSDIALAALEGWRKKKPKEGNP